MKNVQTSCRGGRRSIFLRWEGFLLEGNTLVDDISRWSAMCGRNPLLCFVGGFASWSSLVKVLHGFANAVRLLFSSSFLLTSSARTTAGCHKRSFLEDTTSLESKIVTHWPTLSCCIFISNRDKNIMYVRQLQNLPHPFPRPLSNVNKTRVCFLSATSFCTLSHSMRNRPVLKYSVLFRLFNCSITTVFVRARQNYKDN